MAVFKPFSALRPSGDHVSSVAALPYDVMSSGEAREFVAGKPYSFLNIDRAEVNFDPGHDMYSDEVYAKADSLIRTWTDQGVFIREEKPCYYIYKEIMGGRTQAGIVGCASVDDYLNGNIKKHELTVEEKAQDRIRHVDHTSSNTGPIFLMFRSRDEIESIMNGWMASNPPIYDFVSEDNVTHTVWRIDEDGVIAELESLFAEIPALYIADGHHRARSAVEVGLKRRSEHAGFTGEEEFNYFLAVCFPDNKLEILDYNRVVYDLNGLTKEEFLGRLAELFDISEPIQTFCPENEVKPEKKHDISMYLDHCWYKLTAHTDLYDPADTVGQLDVSILQNKVLSPILGIGDPRTDKRIEFIGGIRGLNDLVRRVDAGKACAFAMYPTTIEDLMKIADHGDIMPPKSTWFEPKLRSGIFIHEFER